MVPGEPKCQWDMPVIVGVSVGQVISRVPSHHGSSVSKPVFVFDFIFLLCGADLVPPFQRSLPLKIKSISVT